VRPRHAHAAATAAALTAAAILLSASGAAYARSEYEGVTSLVLEAVYGAANLRVDDPEQVKVVVQEINALRRRNWSSYQGKPAPCAVRFTLLSTDRRVGRLVLQGSELLEPGPNQASGYKRDLGNFDAPVSRRLAARIRRPGECAR
jgi:hypothetical protein